VKTNTRMAIRVKMRALLLGLASATALLGQVDARQMIRRVVAADESNWRVARNYRNSPSSGVFVSARLGLLKVLHIEQEISYSKCREFQTDSPIISRMKAR
jgi:hypothetical protein